MAAKKKNSSSELTSQADPCAPLDGALLLSKAQRLLGELEMDLLERARGSIAVSEALRARHEAEHAARRTADPRPVWERHFVTQVAASWILSCVFVRTLEDRGLLGRNRIAGPGAADSQRLFFEVAPSLTEREYLLTVFRELTRLPAAKELFDARHNPVWLLGPSADAAKKLVALFRTPNADAPGFRFGQADTRFLGDLYQDLSAEVRERYALLQTPRFVEKYILDRTLDRAIERFGLDETTIIDPTCGSGHFLLGAFERLVDHRLQKEPGLDVREAARRALDAVYGADINPYAVMIARFRLTLAFLENGGYRRLSDAHRLTVQVVVADSLFHASQQTQLDEVASPSSELAEWNTTEFALEDEPAAKNVLLRHYAAVVGNPPYITVKDAVLRDRYRKMYPTSAVGKYSLGAPFAECFFRLAKAAGGFVGMITANSFMKREFGKKLIEEFLPTKNLDGVVNTSGAYIPGHGTPTVLLFGTNEAKRGNDVLTVLAKRGEPRTPDDPERGLVWRSIVEHGGEIGFENDYVSVARVPRTTLEKHPWSLGGGGAAELKDLLEERAGGRLKDLVDDIGFASFTGLDEAFILPPSAARRLGISETLLRPMVIGEDIRDWSCGENESALTPYNTSSQQPLAYEAQQGWGQVLWRCRASLEGVLSFGGKTRKQSGDSWWLWYRWQPERYMARFRIAFAFVATHNHFVLDRGGKVFNRSAPIIKLKEGATEEDHLALLAYLNSSTACFWMKQVFQPKHSAEHKTHPEPERDRYEHAGTQLLQLPVPKEIIGSRELARLAARLNTLAGQMSKCLSFEILEDEMRPKASVQECLRCAWKDFDVHREQMLVLQEEIDWRIYSLLDLVERESPTEEVDLGTGLSCPRGDRPFERVCPRVSFVRRRDHLVPLVEAEVAPLGPLSAALVPLWSRRVEAIRSSEYLAIVERAMFKRQWRDTDDNVDEPSFRRDCDVRRCREWIARSIEDAVSSRDQPTRIRNLISCLELHPRVNEFIELLGASELGEAIASILDAESVPFVGANRHTTSGLAKRTEWERVWDLQRAEDRGERVCSFGPPPKYDQNDYGHSSYWRLRGKLDVPKERFISYPGCESDEDNEPVYGWAGWNHLQQAQAVAALYQKRKIDESWGKDRLTPMLAGLLELIPWVKQWHNEPNAEFGGLRLGDYFEIFLDGECHALGLTRENLRAWRPHEKGRVRKTKARTTDESDDVVAEVISQPKLRKAKPRVETPPRASAKRVGGVRK
jgi:hypothetical protein